MPNNYTDTNVSDLIFNVLDSATYEDLSTNSQLNNNQLYLITDDESSGIEYIVGSQAAATNAWLGTTKEKNLYTGKVIAYKLPYAGTNNAASLTLTLADNSQTPAIPVKLNNTNVTTHYAAGAVILMVYDGAAWRSTDYWNSNSRDPGYGKITPGAASAAVTGITANTTQVTAKTYNEAITVNPGNKWVQLAGSESATAGSDTFTIAHAVQSNVSGNYGDSAAQTPSFGGTFKVPYVSVDEAGHISAISDHNVTIPTKPASASAADAFSSGTTVALTGVVTGTSSSSTKGWSVPTTITDGAVTNSMLTNSSIGIAGNNVSLGGSITAATLRSSLGLNQAMQFIGKAVNTVRDGYSDDPGIGGYDISEAKAGDVIIDKDNSYEYIWTTAGKWERLGPDGNYKITQSAVSSPSASGSATAFIDTISQDANGVITVTKKNLNTSGTWSGTAARATVADSADSIEWDNVINKPSSFTPASHSHGNITNGGDITATAPTVANGDQIIINDHSASKITNGPTFDGSTTTKALTPKGTWETFLNSHQNVTNAGATLSWGEAINIATIGSTNINVTLPSNPNTDTKVSTAAVTSGTTYYPVVGANTTSAATKFYDVNGLVYAGTNGTTSTVGSAKLTLGNSTASGTANNKQGQLILYGSTAYATTITPGAPTAARTITLPDKTGTVALTSDIPAAYSLTAATDSALGGIKIGYSSSGKNYAVQLNNSNQAYVNVPWTDNNDNTTYVFNTTAQTNKIQYKETGASSWTDVPITVSISNNITGSGTRTNGYLAQFSGTNTITNGPQIGSSTTTFLRNDGTWATPPVTSVAGKSGAVSLGTLTIGDKTYNGTGNITISLEDLNIASTTTMLGITDTALSDGNTTNPINLVIPASGSTTAVDSNIVMRQDTGEEFVWLSGAWHKMGVASSYALEHHIHGNITNAGAITSDTTITTGHHLVITDGNNKVSRASITFDTSKTGKALSQAGTWIDVNNYSLPTATSSVLGGVKVGSGLSISSGVLSHTDTSSQDSITATSRTYITGVTLDTYGHVTGLTTGTETVTDTKNTAGSTDTSSKIYLIGATTQAANPQTYSDNEVYATSGVLTAKTFNSTSLTASQAVSTDASKNLVSTNLTVSDPTASGSGITYIATISQSAVGKITVTKSTVRDASDSQSGVVNTGAQTFAGNKTFNNNIIFADDNVGIQRVGRSVSWIGGRSGALLKTTSISGYSPIISTKTTNGSWEIGAYDQSSYADDLVFTYCTDENFTANNNTTTAQIKFLENGHIVGSFDGNVTGDVTGNLSGNAATATKFASAQKVYVTLGTASTTTTIQGGSSSAQTIGVDGTLGVGNGGTGKTSWTQWGVLYASATTTLANTAAGAANTALMGKGSAAPAFVSVSTTLATSTAATASAGQKLKVTVLGVDSSEVELSKATNALYGVTKLTDSYSSTDGTMATTGKALLAAIQTLDVSAVGVAAATGNRFISQISETDGKISATLATATIGGTTQPVYISSGTITAGSTYAGGTAVTLNGSSKAASTASFYAPTSAGTSGYLLRGNGSSAPSWERKQFYYGTCSTAAGTAQKDVVCADYTTLTTGDILVVTFSATNSAAVANLTLKVNTTDAKPIKYMYNNGVSNLPGVGYLLAQTYIFHYDGTNWVIDNLHYNTNTNTAVRTYRSSTNVELPIAGVNTGNATAAYAAIGSGSYKDVYGAIPEDTTKVATLNTSTGVISATTFKPLNSYLELNNIGLRDTELGYAVEFNDEFGRVGNFDTLFAGNTEINSSTISRVTQTATTTSANYEVLFSNTADNTTRTEGARKSNKLTFNPSTGALTATKVYGAVWNDYAEFRQSDQTEPGRVVIEKGDDTLILSTRRLQSGAEIISDTYGFAIGETDNCKTPIAASGRVLAYPFEDRELFKSYIGAPVCSGPNGTVSIMTEEEEMKYPSRIIGTISAVPDYEEWGTGKVKVNGRVWIRIR